MIVALLLLQALTGQLPGFESAPPTTEESIALPHIGDAFRGTTVEARRAAFDAAIALLPKPTRFRAAVQCFRGSVLLSQEIVDTAAATAANDECWRVHAAVPLAQRMKADATFHANDWRTGATLLAKAVTADPRLIGNLEEEHLDTIFRQLGYAKADAERRALVLALAKTDVARDNAALYSGWARESVFDRVEKGDLDGATALLPYVVDPSDGLIMLVDRRYSTLWPRIDEWAAGDLTAQRDALVAASRAAYRADMGLARARTLAAVLGRTGHAGEGAALLAERIAATGGPRDDYDYAGAAVRWSGLIAAAGERDADRILAPMRDGLKDGSGVYRVNLVPNLAMAEIALGQPQAALATLDRFPVDATKVEAAQAIGYFVALRGCAQARLGQGAIAQRVLAEVQRNYAANVGATNLATTCIGSDAQVLAQWIRRVDDPDTRGSALIAMYGAIASTDDEPLTITPGRLRAISARREVTERLARYGRAPAAGYLPAMREWRPG